MFNISKNSWMLTLFICLTASIVAGSVTAEPGNTTIHKVKYPKTFDGTGTIDYINAGQHYISIDDVSYTLAPNVKFFTPSVSNASSGLFYKGMYVGFLLKSDGTVKSLWRLKPKNR